MRTNPGRRVRRAQRNRVHAPTRMSEEQRYAQAGADRFGALLDHLGIVDAKVVYDEDYEDRTEGDGPCVAAPDYTRPQAGRESSAYEFAIMAALQDKPVYQGSVHPDVVARRRAKNRAARRARRADRAAVALLMLVSGFIGAAFYYASPDQTPQSAAVVEVAR